MLLDAREAFRLWAPHYDQSPNPVTALESRLLTPRLGALHGLRFLDAACGTGRWLRFAKTQGAAAAGVDVSLAMLARAPQATTAAELTALPFPDDSFDLAICSFALSYVENLPAAVAELARVSSRVIISDLHPAAAAHWSRGFRAGDVKFEIEQTNYTERDLVNAAARADLTPTWRIEESFGLEELALFRQAGKEEQWDRLRHSPAVLITAWNRASR